MSRHGISPAEASAEILAAVDRMPIERVPIATALHSVLAEPIVAPVSIPPWRSSSMDGYAAHASDIARVPCRLNVVGEIAAGATRSRPLSAGEAVRIMTGATVPDGADTVVRIEDTDGGTTVVEIRDGRDAGRNVRPHGEDFREGDLLLDMGTRLGPAAIGVLASAGIASVATFRPPTVSIVSSGDELVSVNDFAPVLRGERIVSSNSYSLPALVREAGGRPRDGGITRDDPKALRAAIEGAMACDLLITSGGVSVGDRDFTRTVMRDMGVDIRFWRARIRPGGPIVFGVLEGRPWIGLPGNPVSAVVTFELFVRPAILKMLGETLLFPATQLVTLDEGATTSTDLTHYLRVIVSQQDDGLHARLTGSQSSAVLTSVMRANALLIVPEGHRECKAGEQFFAMPLGGSSLRTAAFPG